MGCLNRFTHWVSSGFSKGRRVVLDSMGRGGGGAIAGSGGTLGSNSESICRN